MSLYSRTKLSYNALKNLTCKLLSPSPRINNPSNNCSSCYTNSSKSYGIIGSSHRISSALGYSKLSKSNLFSFVTTSVARSRRYYHGNRYHGYNKFKQRGILRRYKGWFRTARLGLVTLLFGTCLGVTIYYGRYEDVPYTERKHLVLCSLDYEKEIGEQLFNEEKEKYMGRILPNRHRQSLRVRSIANNIVTAFHERVSSEPGYGSEGRGRIQRGVEEWYKQLRRKLELIKGSNNTHPERMKWEVLVVNEPNVNAYCMPGGKIVVFTGLLELFKSDEEIATIIGHEVGHAVARHSAETITKYKWFFVLQLILYHYIFPNYVVNGMTNVLLKLPFSRKKEKEADYIGLLLMASAGYDPRVAPKVYQKFAGLSKESELIDDYFSTHPSGTTRAKLLSRSQVMGEALHLYREAVDRRKLPGKGNGRISQVRWMTIVYTVVCFYAVFCM